MKLSGWAAMSGLTHSWLRCSGLEPTPAIVSTIETSYSPAASGDASAATAPPAPVPPSTAVPPPFALAEASCDRLEAGPPQPPSKQIATSNDAKRISDPLIELLRHTDHL